MIYVLNVFVIEIKVCIMSEGGIKVYVIYVDNCFDLGNWVIILGLCFELIEIYNNFIVYN